MCPKGRILNLLLLNFHQEEFWQDANRESFWLSKCLTLVVMLCYSSRCRLYMGGILVRREGRTVKSRRR